MPIRLILADAHPLILDGLDKLFSGEEDFKVLARCTNCEDALKAVKQHRPDVLIFDIQMQGKDGLEIARAVRKENLSTRMVLLTAEINEKQLLESVRLSIQGIVLKEMSPQLLVQCIRKVYGGGQWLERASTRLALESMLRREAGAREVAGLLTPREFAVMRLIARGLRNKEIAEQLFINQGTVKTHLHNIYDKLKVKGRLALLHYAQQKGLL